MLLGYYLPYKNMLRSFHCLTPPGGSEENPHTNTCKKKPKSAAPAVPEERVADDSHTQAGRQSQRASPSPSLLP